MKLELIQAIFRNSRGLNFLHPRVQVLYENRHGKIWKGENHKILVKNGPSTSSLPHTGHDLCLCAKPTLSKHSIFFDDVDTMPAVMRMCLTPEGTSSWYCHGRYCDSRKQRVPSIFAPICHWPFLGSDVQVQKVIYLCLNPWAWATTWWAVKAVKLGKQSITLAVDVLLILLLETGFLVNFHTLINLHMENVSRY